jgi:sporulation integral membrane protein YtvI
MFIEIVLMLISSVFITMDWDSLTGFCLRQMNDKTKEVFLQIKEYLIGTLWVCVRSYALIMSITFVELSILLTLIGINHSVLIAFGTACFDILPVLGTGGIMGPWVLIKLLQGEFLMALKIFGVYVTVTVVRNIIEPKIVGGQLGLHPVVTLCSMFVGVQLFGVVGLFGFPIGLSLLRYLNDHGVIRILK